MQPLSNTVLLGVTCTSVPFKWHLIPSNDFSRVHKCERRQTDHNDNYDTAEFFFTVLVDVPVLAGDVESRRFRTCFQPSAAECFRSRIWSSCVGIASSRRRTRIRRSRSVRSPLISLCRTSAASRTPTASSSLFT